MVTGKQKRERRGWDEAGKLQMYGQLSLTHKNGAQLNDILQATAGPYRGRGGLGLAKKR